MSAIDTYFIIFGILLLAYFIVRLAFAYDFDVTHTRARHYTVKDYLGSIRGSKCGPIQFDGKSIETTHLSNRLQRVREELTQGKTPQRPAGFKRALRLENKRAEIARLAFFQSQPPPPPPDPHDTEDGLHLLMV